MGSGSRRNGSSRDRSAGDQQLIEPGEPGGVVDKASWRCRSMP
jgi:hypothetical protein